LLSGVFIRLRASVLSIYSENGQRTAVMIPEGATVQIVSGPKREDRMIDVLWNGRTVAAFTEDIIQRSNVAPSV